MGGEGGGMCACVCVCLKKRERETSLILNSTSTQEPFLYVVGILHQLYPRNCRNPWQEAEVWRLLQEGERQKVGN